MIQKRSQEWLNRDSDGDVFLWTCEMFKNSFSEKTTEVAASMCFKFVSKTLLTNKYKTHNVQYLTK